MKPDAYPLHPIRTEADYLAALKLVAPYFDHEPEPDSKARVHFEALVVLIEAYEAKQYPIEPRTQWKPSSPAWSTGRAALLRGIVECQGIGMISWFHARYLILNNIQ